LYQVLVKLQKESWVHLYLTHSDSLQAMHFSKMRLLILLIILGPRLRESKRGIFIMNKIHLTDLNKKIWNSLTSKEKIIDDFIIVGYLNTLVLFVVLLFLYGLFQSSFIITITSLLLVILVISINIMLQYFYGPKFRLNLQRKYREKYYEERYNVQGSAQRLNSQSYKIQTHLSRVNSFICDIDMYVNKIPDVSREAGCLLILFVDINDEIVSNNHSKADYVVNFKLVEDELNVIKILENITPNKKHELFGKYYDLIVIESYIDFILSLSVAK